MSQSLVKNLMHIVFSTKYREPLLRDRDVRAEMHSYLGGICKNQGCPPIIVGGIEDHVHLLCLLSKNVALCDLMAEMKRDSSKWIKKQGNAYSNFHWQDGYGAFSIGQSQVQHLKRYIANQEEHHRRGGYQEELRKFLNRYEMDFDERYIWG